MANGMGRVRALRLTGLVVCFLVGVLSDACGSDDGTSAANVGGVGGAGAGGGGAGGSGASAGASSGGTAGDAASDVAADTTSDGTTQDAKPNPPGSLVTSPPYGCACDGQTDDTACLSDALGDWANWENATLEWPSAATCVALGLTWTAPTGSAAAPYTLRGNGATLLAPAGAPVVAGNWILRIHGGAWLVVDGLNFDGNRDTRSPAQVAAHNIMLSATRDIELSNVQSIDGVTDNLYVYGETPVETDPAKFSQRVTITNPVMRNAYRNDISIINCDQCRIVGDGKGKSSSCQLTDANGQDPEAGIDFEPNPGSAVPGIVNSSVEGCYIAHNEGRCVQLSSVASPVGTVIRENLLEDCRRNTATCGAGITLGHGGALIEQNTFANFALQSSCRSLIDGSATSAPAPAVVRNNVIQNVTGVPQNGHVLYIHPLNAGGHVFENNTMTNIGVAAGGDWCSDSSSATPNQIDGNTVDGQLQQPNPGCP
jgi:hypothetical protein